MTTLKELPTPALVLDRNKLETNIERMSRHAVNLQVPLRPHMKTPKSLPVAGLLRDAGATAYCVSTLNEAEYMHAGGYSDLYYCVPFAPGKAARAKALIDNGCQLTLMTDTLEGAEASAAAAESLPGNTVFDFTIEIDVDGYRTGTPYTSPDVVRAALSLHRSPSTSFVGLMSYAGASYTKTRAETQALTDSHVRALTDTRSKLVEQGLPCSMLSLGSTPAILHVGQLTGISEIRCGIYIFQDLFQAGIGACEIDDIALTVLATVTARHSAHNRFVIDAGGLALSKDRSTAGRSFDAQYGWVCDAASGKRIDDLLVSAVSQELGLVTTLSGRPVKLEDFPVGSLVRVLPNHADMTAAAYERYAVVRGADEVEAFWPRTNRWD